MEVNQSYDIIEQLDKQYTNHRVQNESHQTKSHDQHGLRTDKVLSPHGEGDGDTQKEGDEICKLILSGIGQSSQNAAFTD